MSNPADRVGTLGAAKVTGITNHRVFQSDPALAQLEGEFAALQLLAIDTQAKLNALITAYNDLATKHNANVVKLNANAGVAESDFAAATTVAAVASTLRAPLL